jgi:hypothetical protein
MNIQRNNHKDSFEAYAPVFLFVEGLTLCIVIRLINIYGMVTSVEGFHWNYLITQKYAGLNYVWLCEISLALFCILSLIFLIKAKRKLYSIALIISCLSIMSNVAFMKAAMKIGHRIRITSLEKHIQNDQTHPNTLIYLETQYKITVESWNMVENEFIEPNTNLYGTCIRRIDKYGDEAFIYCIHCHEFLEGEQLKELIETKKCPVCKRTIIN